MLEITTSAETGLGKTKRPCVHLKHDLTCKQILQLVVLELGADRSGWLRDQLVELLGAPKPQRSPDGYANRVITGGKPNRIHHNRTVAEEEAQRLASTYGSEVEVLGVWMEPVARVVRQPSTVYRLVRGG